jgi:hypothetical protein
MIALLMVCIVLLCVLVGLKLGLDKKDKVETYDNHYRTLNMSVGESPYKCGCPCVSYGSLFDYQAQKRQHKYGVPLGCQKIF